MIMRTKYALPAALVLVLVLSGFAFDKLDDFKEASSKDGCEAIPYQSDRIRCKDRSQDKDRICQAFTCNRDEVDKDLANYKDKLRNLVNAKSRNDEQAARSLEETVKALETRLKEHKALGKDRVDKGYDCLEARELVQRSFSDAKVSVQGESDSALQQYVPALVSKYDRGRQDHVGPMQEVIRAVDNCKWVSEISW